jgi:hypothetical protein
MGSKLHPELKMLEPPPMLIREDQIQFYIDAVKRTRSARQIVALRAASDVEFHKELLDAETTYQQALKELSEQIEILSEKNA